MSLSKLSICLTSQQNGIQAAYKLHRSKGTDVLYVEKELLTVLGDFWIAYIHCFGTETVSSGQSWDWMRPVEMWAILLRRLCIKRSISTVCTFLLAHEHRGTKHSSMCVSHPMLIIDTWHIFGLFPHALERSVCLWYNCMAALCYPLSLPVFQQVLLLDKNNTANRFCHAYAMAHSKQVMMSSLLSSGFEDFWTQLW